MSVSDLGRLNEFVRDCAFDNDNAELRIGDYLKDVITRSILST